jgi:hypothetical protein
MTALHDPLLVSAIAALCLAHFVEYISDYFFRAEYFGGISYEMQKPYRRIIILHLTLIFGGWLILIFKQPMVGMLCLVALKMVFDIRQVRYPLTPPVDSIYKTPEEVQKTLEEQFSKPQISWMKKTYSYANFAAMKASPEYIKSRRLAYWFATRKQCAQLDAFIEAKITAEQRLT